LNFPLQRIHSQNWNYTQLRRGKLSAFISQGGELTSEGSSDFRELYYINLSNGRDELSTSYFQKTFGTLEEAILFINTQYQHFELEDLTQKSGGCSTCDNS